MALVKHRHSELKPSLNSSSKRVLRHKLPEDIASPVIDYNQLQQICAIEGLADGEHGSTEEAHQTFMECYQSMFVKPKLTGVPNHTEKRSIQRSSEDRSISSKSVGGNTLTTDKKSWQPNDGSHDIRDYLPLLHKQKKSENPHAMKVEHIKTLRRILRKLPFERSAAENGQLFTSLQNLPVLREQVDTTTLKELCVVAQLDMWKEPDITVFGNTGFHMILRGTVQPQTDPCLVSKEITTVFRSPTPEPKEPLPELHVGDCFGTLVKVEGRDDNSRILTTVTKDANCEFLKITTSDYSRVVEQIHQRDRTEKVTLLQGCAAYKEWSRLPLLQVANLVEWITYPPNTVLVSEGYKSPFIAIMKSGQCHVLRQLEVLETLANGKQEKKTKQVVMGRLTQSESFGEMSVLLDEPITCSIVTATAVKLGIIEPEKLEELDEVTLQLLQQCSKRTFGDLTQDDIHEEYMQQEIKREWNEFKHHTVVDVINSKGIRPGYGKWSK